MTIDHFIYDFDGTLSDSYPVFVEIVHEIIRRRNGRLLCSEAELYREMKIFVNRAYPLIEWESGYSKQDFMADFHELQEAYAKRFKLFDGARELLEAVVKSGKKNYLYTHSGSVVRDIMDNTGISQYFTYVLDASQGFPLKPAPDALLSLIERFQLDPKACVMIGDRPIDVEAGANAGMQSCFWDLEGYFPNTPATHHVDRLSDIQSLI